MIGASDAVALLALTLRLSAVGIFIQSCEVLSHGRELCAGRLFGRIDRRTSWWRNLIRVADDFPGCAWILAMRAALAATAVFVPYPSVMAFVVAAALVSIQLYYNRRLVILAGNCETVFLIALVAAGAGALPQVDAWVRGVALAFMAAQVVLAYFVAGLHKLRSRAWSDGQRLRQIAADGPYLWPSFALPLARGNLARLSSWWIIGWELAMPAALVLPSPYFEAMLVGGVVFHGLVAVVMGLHGFWWSFMAAYPGLIYVHGKILGGGGA